MNRFSIPENKFSKGDFILWLVKENDPETKCIKSKTIGDVVWHVQEKEFDDGSRRRMIVCDEIIYNEEKGWMVNDYCEQTPPPFLTCPVEFFDLVPDVACQQWRDQVCKL